MQNESASAGHNLATHERCEAVLPLHRKVRPVPPDRSKGDRLFGSHVVDFIGSDLPWESFGKIAIQAFRPAEACVYFIGGDQGAIKIGTSCAPLERLSAFQLGSPIRLRILALVTGGKAVETRYHSRFREHHSHGEWFNPAPEILAEIDRLSPVFAIDVSEAAV